MHISQLKALNWIVAARVFISQESNIWVRIVCDNFGAITSLSTGKGRDPVITTICRAFWFFSATWNIKFIFTHAPGHTVEVADALSRQHLSTRDPDIASKIVHDNALSLIHVDPGDCDYSKLMEILIHFRSGPYASGKTCWNKTSHCDSPQH